MRWSEIDQQTCSVARALSEIGDRWTLLLIRDAFLRARRFDDFVERSGAARNVVANRLEKLVASGILERRAYQTRPERHEYRLTEKGRDLYPVIMTLVAWGDRWHDDGAGPPVRHQHRGCGKRMHAVVACSECREALDPRETRVTVRKER
ncbi:MAG: helix-turn-helix domain-containing protein [Myxococcales bacterium]|nr:helix-turn-helix domain-containing protein [Myxococcales bacterium]